MRVPNTVKTRLLPLIQVLHPELTEENANTVMQRVYDLIGYVAHKRFDEEKYTAKDVMTFGVQNALTLSEDDWKAFLRSLLPKRCLSADVRIKRLKEKMLKMAEESGIEIEFKGE